MVPPMSMRLGFQKLCIFESARSLPTVPGLIVVASRAEARAGGKSFALEIDIRAAGQEATYRFVCASQDGRTAVIHARLIAHELDILNRDGAAGQHEIDSVTQCRVRIQQIGGLTQVYPGSVGCFCSRYMAALQTRSARVRRSLHAISPAAWAFHALLRSTRLAVQYLVSGISSSTTFFVIRKSC